MSTHRREQRVPNDARSNNRGCGNRYLRDIDHQSRSDHQSLRCTLSISRTVSIRSLRANINGIYTNALCVYTHTHTHTHNTPMPHSAQSFCRKSAPARSRETYLPRWNDASLCRTTKSFNQVSTWRAERRVESSRSEREREREK